MKVTVKYLRKINLGDYNAAHIGIEIEEDVTELEQIAFLWNEAKESVKEQALPLMKQQEPAQRSVTPAEALKENFNAEVQEVHPIEHMEITYTQSGKRAYIKVFAGPFTKYGVAMYAEVVDTYEELNGWQAEMEPNLEYGPEFYAPYTQAVITEDDKGRKKVIALR